MIVKAAIVAVFGAVVYSLVKTYKPEYAVLCEVGSVAVIFILIADNLVEIKSFFSGLIANAGVSEDYLKILLKALGTALVTQFAADTARDSGENALASKIEFAGRVVIVYCSLPLIKGIAQLITQVTGGM